MGEFTKQLGWLLFGVPSKKERKRKKQKRVYGYMGKPVVIITDDKVEFCNEPGWKKKRR